MDPVCCLDKVCGVTVVLLHTSGHSQHVGVEDDIQRIHAHLFRQQTVGPFCNLYTTFVTGSLSLFIEAHDYHGSTIALDITGMFQELLFSFL